MIDYDKSTLYRDSIEEIDKENILLSKSTRVGRTDFVLTEVL